MNYFQRYGESLPLVAQKDTVWWKYTTRYEEARSVRKVPCIVEEEASRYVHRVVRGLQNLSYQLLLDLFYTDH